MRGKPNGKGEELGVWRPTSCTGVQGPSAPPSLGCLGQPPKERLQAGVHLTGTQPEEAHCRPSPSRDQGQGSLSCFARSTGSRSSGGAVHPCSPSRLVRPSQFQEADVPSFTDDEKPERYLPKVTKYVAKFRLTCTLASGAHFPL